MVRLSQSYSATLTDLASSIAPGFGCTRRFEMRSKCGEMWSNQPRVMVAAKLAPERLIFLRTF
jgi:hypothetical protein